MKECPVCKSVVDEESECPICGNTITYTPFSPEPWEHIPLNRYSLLYTLKNIWFSLLCCLFGGIKTLITRPQMSELLVTAAVFALFSLVVALTQRKFAKAIRWKYTERYAIHRVALWKYLFGAVSVVLFLICK